MGRRKLFDTRLNLTLPDGVKEQISAHLEAGEDRNAFVREAIRRELKRRAKGRKVMLDPKPS